MTDDELLAYGETWQTLKRPILMRVTKRDYAYNGYFAGLVIKRSSNVRAVIEDDCGRLFIHNASELEVINGQETD